MGILPDTDETAIMPSRLLSTCMEGAAVSTEKVPKAMADKFTAITALTDAFCELHLNDEYRSMIHRAIGALARKRPSPLLKGKEQAWAAATIHAIGRANFLDDPTQAPHCKSKVIYEFFGIAESTGQNKSKEIRGLLKIDQFSPEWTLPSRLANNPMVWMLQINGFIVDIRHQPLELQEAAYKQGLIPFIPGKQVDNLVEG